MALRYFSVTIKLLMSDNYFTDNLVLYMYNELDAEQKSRFEAELAENQELQQRLFEAKQALAFLDDASVEPSATSVNLILEHAKNINQKEALERI